MLLLMLMLQLYFQWLLDFHGCCINFVVDIVVVVVVVVVLIVVVSVNTSSNVSSTLQVFNSGYTLRFVLYRPV